MSFALIILWILVVVFLIALVITSLSAMGAWRRQNTVVIPPNARCLRPLNELVQLEGLPCCVVGATLTASRYVPSLDMVVNPLPVYYLQACQGFCREGTITDNDTTRCVNGIGQDAYQSCLDLINPRTCLGPALPVAALGTVYFYTNSATNTACTTTRACT